MVLRDLKKENERKFADEFIKPVMEEKTGMPIDVYTPSETGNGYKVAPKIDVNKLRVE